MSEEGESEKVGFKRPPKAGQFKPGRSGNPRGSRKFDDHDVAAILDAEVPVRVGSRMRKMSGFELTARGLFRRALEGKSLPAAIDFVRLCEKYKAIAPPFKRQSSTITVPFGWSIAEYQAMWAKHGPPPWPGPRSGLTKADVQLVREMLQPKKKPERPEGPRTRAMILEDLLDEKHNLSENGRQRRRSTRFLILRVLRQHAISGNMRAARVVEDLLERYGRSQLKRGGYAMFPEAPSTPEEIEEYEKMVSEQQRQFREKK